MRTVVRGNKMRTLASKSIRIQKTLGKVLIDNNQKVTWVFYYQLSKLQRVNFLTLSYYYTEIDENSSTPSYFLVFTGARQSGDWAGSLI